MGTLLPAKYLPARTPKHSTQRFKENQTNHLKGIMSQETILSNYQGKYQDKYLASTEFGKEASGTIGDYLTGTITLVFGIFFLFLLLSVLTIILTTYARYKSRKENPSSFANPPPRAYRPQLQEPLSNAPPAATSGQSTLL